jgi:acetolactate synthase-1/2/3 large subunit
MKLSDFVFQFVRDLGVKHVFLVTGGGAMHLNESLGRVPEIEPVCNSHEQASAIGAENYAKVTGNIGVALLTTGPGGTNAITGVAGAWLDSTPCLFISGQVKRPDRMFDAEGKPLGMRQLGVQEVRGHGTGSAIDSLSPGAGGVSRRKRASRAGVDRYTAGCAGCADR